MNEPKISRTNWDNINQLDLSSEKLEKIKQLKEKSIEVEGEFFNLFLKEMTKKIFSSETNSNALLGTGGDFVGRELGKQWGEFTQHQFAKDLFFQESNKLIGELEK